MATVGKMTTNFFFQSVNGLPHEQTRIFSRPSHCHDGWYEQNLSCNKQRSLDSDEEFAWDSQVTNHNQCCQNVASIKTCCRDSVADAHHTLGKSGGQTAPALVG